MSHVCASLMSNAGWASFYWLLFSLRDYVLNIGSKNQSWWKLEKQKRKSCGWTSDGLEKHLSSLRSCSRNQSESYPRDMSLFWGIWGLLWFKRKIGSTISLGDFWCSYEAQWACDDRLFILRFILILSRILSWMNPGPAMNLTMVHQRPKNCALTLKNII